MQVNDHETLQLSIADASILELADMTTLTVTRTDTRGELTVDLRGDDASEATVVAVVRIPDGQATSLPVVVSGIDDFLLDGTQTVAFTATATGYEPGSATLDVADHESWQNPYNRLDVTFDGVVAPNDVLSIVNDINARGSRPLPPPTASAGPPSFLDVVLDGIVAPSDALAVINFFNSSSRTGGEAEASAGGLPAAQHVWPLELDDGQFERSRVAVAVETRPVLDVHRSNRPARLPTTTVWRHRLPAAADVAPSRHFEPLDIESSALDRIADLEEVLSGIAEDVSRRMNSARNQVKSEWRVSS